MTQATLKAVGQPSEPWGDNRLVFIDLHFEDHTSAALTTNEQGLQARTRELAERLGKPAEWNFGTNSKGKPTVKIPKVDGAPGGPRGGGWKPKPIEERQEEMARSLLHAAVALCQEWNGIKFERASELVREEMDRFLAYSRAALNVGAEPRGYGEGPTGSAPSTTASSGTDGAALREFLLAKPDASAPGGSADPPPRDGTPPPGASSSEGGAVPASGAGESPGASRTTSQEQPGRVVAAAEPSSEASKPHRFKAENPDSECVICHAYYEAEVHRVA